MGRRHAREPGLLHPRVNPLPGKRRRAGAGNFNPSPPVMNMSRENIVNSASFRELQNRQLSVSSEKFPKLFKDLVKSSPPCVSAQPKLAVPSAGVGSLPSRASLGGFAQRSRAPASTAGNAPSTGVSVLKPGAVVTCHGLLTTDLNGARGTLRHRDEASDRWEVEVD